MAICGHYVSDFIAKSIMSPFPGTNLKILNYSFAQPVSDEACRRMQNGLCKYSTIFS
jgi:hypothetical protein